jgi:ABC-2 type transport system ATP-binding protein
VPDAVTVASLRCRFGTVVALDGVSFDVATGAVVGLLGPNGSGKTTIMDVICGLLAPSGGDVSVFGHAVVPRNLRAVRRLIGVVPQETALYDELSARENLRFAAVLHGIAQPRQRVEEMLALVGLTARADERCDRLSGGMRRRLVIARALVHAPRLLILDEPTLGVDVEARHDIWRHLQRLRDAGTTVLLATNYLDEASALCDRVVVLRAGRVVVQGTPDELTARAGRYVELDCRREDVAALARELRRRDGVLAVEEEPSALRVHVGGDDGAAEDVVQAAAATAALLGFRTRPPDLAEIFRALDRTR